MPPVGMGLFQQSRFLDQSFPISTRLPSLFIEAFRRIPKKSRKKRDNDKEVDI